MRTIIFSFLFGGLLAFSACRSTSYCRSTKVEEIALQYLVDSIFTTAYKDSVEIFINPKIHRSQIISSRYRISRYFADHRWIMDTLIGQDTELTIYDCRKKEKVTFKKVKIKTPKGYPRVDWNTYFHMNKKGKNTTIIQIFNFGRWINNAFYVDFSCYNRGSYLLVFNKYLDILYFKYVPASGFIDPSQIKEHSK